MFRHDCAHLHNFDSNNYNDNHAPRKFHHCRGKLTYIDVVIDQFLPSGASLSANPSTLTHHYIGLSNYLLIIIGRRKNDVINERVTKLRL